MRGSSKTRIVGWLVGSALVFSAVSAIAQTVPPSIIDTHVHLLPGNNLEFAEAADAATRKMDKYGISTSFLMSPPRSKAISQNFDHADLRTVVKKYPGRFLLLGGGGTLNLTLHAHSDASQISEKTKKSFADKASELASEAIIGFGEISSLHISLAERHAYNFVPADHPLLRVLADVAAEQGIPIDLHMDAVFQPMKPPARLSKLPNNPGTFPETLLPLDRLLAHNPNAKVIWAHGGTDHLGDFSPQRIRRLMNKHKNLFVSLKVVGPKAGTYNRIFRPGAIDPEWLSLLRKHSDRFVIGTDSFHVDPNSRGPGKVFATTSENRLKATRAFLSLLPADLARKIARENAIRLYTLAPKQAPVLPSPSGGNARSTLPKRQPVAGKGLCRDGNMSHCKIACSRGIKQACARLKRGN